MVFGFALFPVKSVPGQSLYHYLNRVDKSRRRLKAHSQFHFQCFHENLPLKCWNGFDECNIKTKILKMSFFKDIFTTSILKV